MDDLLIRGALLIDGTGAPASRGDLAVSEGKIAGLGRLGNRSAGRVVDADGLALSPGFIDLHGHTDWALVDNPTAESKLAQGMTTELGGNCGTSPLPLCEQLEFEAETRGADALYRLGEDTLPNFARLLEDQGIAVNFACLLGHGNLRALVMGYRAGVATPVERSKIAEISADRMGEGYFGLSTGLIYPPGCYADRQEIAEAARPAAAAGGFYASHIRNERDGLLDAVAEALWIGRRAGIPVHLSHHKVTGKENWGRVRESISLVERAQSEGQEITADQYPYQATATTLAALLPAWAREGGHQATMGRINNPEIRQRLAGELGQMATDPSRWDNLLISLVQTEANRPLQGKTLREICALRDCSPLDAICDLLVEEQGKVQMIGFAMCEEDIELVMSRPWVAVGSDSSARTTSGPLSQGRPHPRAFGTFPRVLGRYVRERGVLTLEEAVRKMTGLPAWRMGLSDRGRLAVGCWADLVLFDPTRVADRADFSQPIQLPSGIEAVFVNGVEAIREGSLTGALPGRVLLADRNSWRWRRKGS